MKIPYPLSAACLCIAFHPFSVFGGTWFDYVNRSSWSEDYKKRAETIWWIRFMCFTISYRRML